MTRRFTINVEITTDAPDARQADLDSVQARCHDIVSAVVTAFKHQRPKREAKGIGTSVQTTQAD